jgi:acyl-CoA synthetase (AMP-forming)/AMP-acid ligase II
VTSVDRSPTAEPRVSASSARDLWQLGSRGDATALIDATSGARIAYRELHARAQALATQLVASSSARPRAHFDERADTHSAPSSSRPLVFVLAGLDVGSVVAYLGALAADAAVCLLDRDISPSLREQLAQQYRPDFVLTAHGDDVEVTGLPSDPARPIHPALGVLLSTSGTTGSPKLVRLSHDNLRANARSIASYLELTHDERAISSLPFHYSYGLSVLNSHLWAGASVVVSAESVMRPELWNAVREHACTSFAGVPYAYQIMRRVGFEKMELPSLRTLTQAGGKLPDNLTAHYHKLMAARGGRFFTMYGQTEATARMSYLPPARATEKPGSIGIAIPEGALRIVDPVTGETLHEPRTTGEIVYSGPNVMLGYATQAAELALGDTQQGELRTGDLGHCDADGFFYVTGRLKRFAKVYGLRVNLDDVEARVRAHGPAAGVSDDERLSVFVEFGEPAEHEALRAELAEIYKLNLNTFRVQRVDSLPLLASGKVDYASLQQRTR